MDETELLTVSQAAEAFSATSQTIRNWIRADRINSVRIGNRFLAIPPLGGRAATWRNQRGSRGRHLGSRGVPPADPLVRRAPEREARSRIRRRTTRGYDGLEQAFNEAREVWRAALREHVLAPPDSGFSGRIAQPRGGRRANARRRARPRTRTGSSGPRRGAARSRRTSFSPARAGVVPQRYGSGSTRPSTNSTG